MKKLLDVSDLLIIGVLVMLLAVGSVGALEIEPEIEPDIDRDGEGGGEAEPEADGPAEAEPEGAALRINFKVGGHVAKKGLYIVQTPGGGKLTSWTAQDGWVDSGWISNLDLGRETLWVEVVYYPGPNTEGTVMRILNHVPGEPYGWVSQGMGHAIEVAWPDQPLVNLEGTEAAPQETLVTSPNL